MEIAYRNGIHLPHLDLWMDPHHTRASAFVTHAHSDHMKPHGVVYTTEHTAALMRARGATRTRFQIMEPGEWRPWQEARVALYPAGHVLGSAQVLVEQGGTRLLYSGDFKMRPGASAAPIEVPQADILIMETTFGRPRYRFPDAGEVMAQIVEWCHESLGEGYTPVLLCYSLGKGQEVLAGLAGAGLPICLESAHYKMTEVYRRCGVTFPEYCRLEEGQQPEGVLLCGGGCRRKEWFAQLRRPRTAYISGWALDGPWRSGADCAFPLSDHADYGELLEYVRLTGAGTIYTQHGFDRQFAADLRNLGLEARPLSELKPGTPRQLRLF